MGVVVAGPDTCFHCKAESDAAHYRRVVHNEMALHSPWQGWRMSGRYLVAPNKAGRITPERLGSELFMQTQRAKLLAMTRLKRSITTGTQP